MVTRKPLRFWGNQGDIQSIHANADDKMQEVGKSRVCDKKMDYCHPAGMSWFGTSEANINEKKAKLLA